MATTDMTARRFDNRVAQVAIGAFGGLVVLLGLAGLAASSGTALFYLLVGIFTLARGVRSSSVVVDQSGVTTRSIVRTRRYQWSALRSAEVGVGRTGLVGFGREHLVFCLTDGQEVPFKELNCAPPEAAEETSVVRCAAACINDQLGRS